MVQTLSEVHHTVKAPSRILSPLFAATDPFRSEATRGGYETFDASANALKLPYTALAALLNCAADEIAIVSSATAAWQQVMYGLAWTWRPGDRVRLGTASTSHSAAAARMLHCVGKVCVGQPTDFEQACKGHQRPVGQDAAKSRHGTKSSLCNRPRPLQALTSVAEYGSNYIALLQLAK